MLNQQNNNQITERKSFRTGAIALALMALILPACSSPEDTTGVTEEENVTTEEVAEDTEELLGQTVTVRSNVDEAVDDVSFTVTDEELFGDEEILVVNASGTPFVLPADDTELQVTGEVAMFVLADLETEYNLELDPELYVDYENKPAIIAESIALAPEPGEITENPDQFYNQVVAVEGEVENIVGPNAFRLDEDELVGGGDLLVLIPNPERTINEGEAVVATGTVRQFVVAELERDYDLTWDLDVQQELEAEYTEKPVIIANDVYPSAE